MDIMGSNSHQVRCRISSCNSCYSSSKVKLFFCRPPEARAEVTKMLHVATFYWMPQICVKNLKKDDRVQKKRQYPHLNGPLVHERFLLALICVHVLFFFACIRRLLDNAWKRDIQGVVFLSALFSIMTPHVCVKQTRFLVRRGVCCGQLRTKNKKGWGAWHMDLQGILDKQSQTPQIEIIQKAPTPPKTNCTVPLQRRYPSGKLAFSASSHRCRRCLEDFCRRRRPFGAVVWQCQVVGSARETLCFVGFLVVFKVDWMLF